MTRAPLSQDDAAEVTRVWRAGELHDDGVALFTEEDFIGAWQRPSFDFARDSLGVRDGGSLVAFAMMFGRRDVFVSVLPSHRGRGLGTSLMRWSQEAGRAAGHEVTHQMVSEKAHAAAALLEADGYERKWEGWILDVELDAEPGPPQPPDGYAIRDFVPGRDDRDAYRVIEDAFGEWSEHEPDTYEDWVAETLGRPGFVPEHIALVTHGDEVVGAAVLVEDDAATWVGQLAVERAHRGRGLGRALLQHAFGVAWRRPTRRCALATDSRTGARGLYEHVGMKVRRAHAEYAKLL
jgi:mycothiol synthase